MQVLFVFHTLIFVFHLYLRNSIHGRTTTMIYCTSSVITIIKWMILCISQNKYHVFVLHYFILFSRYSFFCSFSFFSPFLFDLKLSSLDFSWLRLAICCNLIRDGSWKIGSCYYESRLESGTVFIAVKRRKEWFAKKM